MSMRSRSLAADNRPYAFHRPIRSGYGTIARQAPGLHTAGLVGIRHGQWRMARTKTLPAAAAWHGAPMTGLPCPSCRQQMEKLRLESRTTQPVELDLCFNCHGIWFDQRENLQLSPAGVLTLFERLHAHKDQPHSVLKPGKACPRCQRTLVRGMDRTISGSYVVYRCPQHHGRFGSFSSFMVEKGFVRQLSRAEIHSLAAKVRTIHCGNCGAPVDLRQDHACPYCRSAFSLLDPHAVEAAIAHYQRSDLALKLAISALIPADHAPASQRRNQPAQREIDEMTHAVQQARIDLLKAQSRIESLREKHRREQQLEGLQNGLRDPGSFGDELWAAGLSLLGRMIKGLFP